MFGMGRGRGGCQSDKDWYSLSLSLVLRVDLLACGSSRDCSCILRERTYKTRVRVDIGSSAGNCTVTGVGHPCSPPPRAGSAKGSEQLCFLGLSKARGEGGLPDHLRGRGRPGAGPPGGDQERQRQGPVPTTGPLQSPEYFQLRSLHPPEQQDRRQRPLTTWRTTEDKEDQEDHVARSSCSTGSTTRSTRTGRSGPR